MSTPAPTGANPARQPLAERQGPHHERAGRSICHRRVEKHHGLRRHRGPVAGEQHRHREAPRSATPGISDAEHGGDGVHAYESTHVKLYYNTVHDTARHGIPHQRAPDSRWWATRFTTRANAEPVVQGRTSGTWRSPPSRGPCPVGLQADWELHPRQLQSALTCSLGRGDGRGEPHRPELRQQRRLRLQPQPDGHGNWLYATSDQFNRQATGRGPAGIQLANEGKAVGRPLNNIRITNNIIEWVEPGRALLARRRTAVSR